MRALTYAAIVATLVAVTSGPAQVPTRTTATVDPAARNIGVAGERAVSLRVFQQELGAPSGSKKHPTLRTLCGLRRIDAVVADPKTRDLILVGSTKGPLALYAADLVIALRCSFSLYGTRVGNIIHTEAPGVSIDPNPRIIAAIDDLINRNQPDARGLQQAFEKLGSSPQAVRILGMPFCRASAAALDCDYHLKRLSNGTVTVPGANMKSLFALRMASFNRQSVFGTRRLSTSMNRFWFTPDPISFKEDNGVAVLERAPVRLLTEAQYQRGTEIHGTGHPDALAESWVAGFTRKFGAIAAKDPRYQDLANLYRTFAIAEIIRARNRSFDADQVLNYLLYRCRVSSAKIPPTLPGLTRFVLLSNGRIQELQTYCGGVDLGAQITRNNVVPDPTRFSNRLARQTMTSRPSPSALFWTVLGLGEG